MMVVQLGVVTLLSSCVAIAWEPQEWLWDHIFLFLPWIGMNEKSLFNLCYSTESPTLTTHYIPIVFLAISEGLGFTLMAVGQTFSPPTHAGMV